MGFHVGAKVTVVSRAGESVIVNIKGVRVAIGKELAGKIFV
jgi:ferrous iron transport protein A